MDENILNENILHLVDGNPGAIEVMIKLARNYPDKLTSLLTLLQTNNIRGMHIWMIYKLCKKNIDEFVLYPFDTYTSAL
jgi:hypothetical protein